MIDALGVLTHTTNYSKLIYNDIYRNMWEIQIQCPIPLKNARAIIASTQNGNVITSLPATCYTHNKTHGPIGTLVVAGGLLGFQIIKNTNFIRLNNRDTALN